MKYLVMLSKLSFIFLLMMLHLSLVKQWVSYFSEQPVSLKPATIQPVMIHFVATIPPAPLPLVAMPDKKSNVKMTLPKSELKQSQKLNKLPISSVQTEKAISPQKIQKTNAPVQKNRPAPITKAAVQPVVKSEKSVVAKKSVTPLESTPPVATKTETKAVPTLAAPVEKPTEPASPVLSTVPTTVVKTAIMPKISTSQLSSAGKTISSSTETIKQSQVYTPPNHRSAYLHNPKPLYPEISQQLEEQGTVQLLVYVNSLGQVSQAQIKHSSGYPRLDNAALQAVKQWQFIPAKQGDKPIAATTLVPITFRLDEE